MDYISDYFSKNDLDKDFIVINHKRYSLGQVEHEIVRGIYKDPRAHFALVCASISCPPLRSEAYEGYKLEEQLHEQGIVFSVKRERINFKVDKKRAHISKL